MWFAFDLDDCFDVCCGLEGFSISEDFVMDVLEDGCLDLSLELDIGFVGIEAEELVLVVPAVDCVDDSLRLVDFPKSDSIGFVGIDDPEDADCGWPSASENASLEEVDSGGIALPLEEALTDDFVLDLEINDFHAFEAFRFDFLSLVQKDSFSKLKMI